MRTVKCYNIVHNALMISTVHPLPSLLFFIRLENSPLLTNPCILFLFFFLFVFFAFILCLEDVFFKFYFCNSFFGFLSNNALLTLMVPYASDVALLVVVNSSGNVTFCRMGDLTSLIKAQLQINSRLLGV